LASIKKTHSNLSKEISDLTDSLKNLEKSTKSFFYEHPNTLRFMQRAKKCCEAARAKLKELSDLMEKKIILFRDLRKIFKNQSEANILIFKGLQYFNIAEQAYHADLSSRHMKISIKVIIIFGVFLFFSNRLKIY
jgi:hypothetical protein